MLVANNYEKLAELRKGINEGKANGRVANMQAMSNKQSGIIVSSGEKTLEYQICKANVKAGKTETQETWLYELIKNDHADEIKKVDTYLGTIDGNNLTDEQQQNVLHHNANFLPLLVIALAYA
jgi:putative ATP-dependent endonuclease of OLD family